MNNLGQQPGTGDTATDRLLDTQPSTPTAPTTWMRVQNCAVICAMPIYVGYAIPAAVIGLLTIGCCPDDIKCLDSMFPSSKKAFLKQLAIGAIIEGLIVIAVLQTTCIRGFALTNRSSYDLDFATLDPKDSTFSPQLLTAGATAIIKLVANYMTATAQFSQSPGYYSITLDNDGHHAHDAGGLVKLKHSFPEHDWGVCRYYLEDAVAPTPIPASCQQISVINLTDLTCEQTGNLQPAGATTSSTTLAANGGSATYTFQPSEPWITIDYYNGLDACGTWTFDNQGQTAKTDNTANALEFVGVNGNTCVYHYQNAETVRSLRGQWYDFFAVEKYLPTSNAPSVTI